jgi:hypothetical protein
MQDRRATRRSSHTPDIAIDESGSYEEAAWIRHYLKIADTALFDAPELPPRRSGIFLASGQLRRPKHKTLHPALRF